MIEHTTTSAVNSPHSTRIALWSGPRSPYGKALSAINALPDDLLLEIFARLSATELLLAGQVSQRWRLLSGTLRVHGRSMRGLLSQWQSTSITSAIRCLAGDHELWRRLEQLNKKGSEEALMVFHKLQKLGTRQSSVPPSRWCGGPRPAAVS